MNSNDSAPNPAPGESAGGHESKPNKKPRRHLLGLPPGYRFDPHAGPTPEDLYGVPVCFGDEDRLRRGEGRTEGDGPSVGL